MAAHELVRQSIPVIMLESGRNPPDGMLVRIGGRTVFRCPQNMGLDNVKRHVSTGDPKTTWWFNFSPGGLSNQWAGAVPRFAPEDFYEGERLHERYRWPFSYEDLLPFYEQVERLLCITAEPYDVPNMPAVKPAYISHLPRDWKRIAGFAARRGQGLTVLPLAGGPPYMAVSRSTAFNSYTNLVLPLLLLPPFQLITGAHALYIEYSGTKRRAAAVVYQDRVTNTQHRLEADAIVVACGALNSTKLLFDSACPEFPQGLGNNVDVLGRYLHDHPRDWWTFEVEKALSRPHPPTYLTRLPYHVSAPLLATSWTIGLLPSAREKLLSFTPLKGHFFAAQVLGTMIPTVQHYARPNDTGKDEFGLPLLNLCIQYEEDVVSHLISAREHLLSILEDAGYRGTLHNTPTNLKPGISVHYGGTIRMHGSRKYGMLDAWNRLHEVRNLLVVDNSCFTTGPEKNPTLTAMAIAARAANRLACDLRKGEPDES